MTKFSRLVGPVLAATFAVGLAGCSSSTPTAPASSNPLAAYCEAVKFANNDASLKDISPSDKVGTKRFLAAIVKIEGLAPEHIKAEWTTLRSALEELSKDDADNTKIDGPALQTATQKIATEVKTECGVDMS